MASVAYLVAYILVLAAVVVAVEARASRRPGRCQVLSPVSAHHPPWADTGAPGAPPHPAPALGTRQVAPAQK